MQNNIVLSSIILYFILYVASYTLSIYSLTSLKADYKPAAENNVNATVGVTQPQNIYCKII